MNGLIHTLTAALRRSWRPLALAGTVVAVLVVALTIAFAQTPSPRPLGGPVRVEQPRTDTTAPSSTAPQGGKASQPAQGSQGSQGAQSSSGSQGSSSGSQSSGDSQSSGGLSAETTAGDDDVDTRPQPAIRSASQPAGAVPVPRLTVPAAGSEQDETEPADDDGSEPGATVEDDEPADPADPAEPADTDDG